MARLPTLTRVLWIPMAAFLLLVLIANGQEAKVKKAPATYVAPVNGEQLYTHYCASCHGTDLKGGGPAAKSVAGPVPDLTTMAQRNHGQFDSQKVVQIVNGTMDTPGHGTKDMPVWGVVLPQVYPNKTVSDMAINHLVEFIRQRQVK